MKKLTWVFVLMIASCQTPTSQKGGWQKVFQNDSDGQTRYGDKSALIEAVRLGYPVRIGWGGMRVEHVADADFLTIFEGEVFAQIRSIIGQAPRIDGDTVKIRFRMENRWTKIAGTNGYSTGFMSNYLSDSIVGGGIDRYNPTTWYVLYPSHDLNIEPTPLWRSQSPNWEKWNDSSKE